MARPDHPRRLNPTVGAPGIRRQPAVLWRAQRRIERTAGLLARRMSTSRAAAIPSSGAAISLELADRSITPASTALDLACAKKVQPDYGKRWILCALHILTSCQIRCDLDLTRGQRLRLDWRVGRG